MIDNDRVRSIAEGWRAFDDLLETFNTPFQINAILPALVEHLKS
jgi:hypothetical protein